MASKPRPDRTIHKCKHCGWTYIESCDCRRYARPTRRRPTDSEKCAERWRFLRDRKVQLSVWYPSGGYCVEVGVDGTWIRADDKSLDRAMDRLMKAVLREEAQRA